MIPCGSFEKIYISWFARMGQFAQEYVLVEEDAENIVQDIFTELWARRELLDHNMNLVAFLFTSIRNRCLDFLRHRMVENSAALAIQEEYRLTLQMKLASLELFDQTIFSNEDIEDVISKLLDSLPEKCRVIFIKSKIEGKKQKEIAEEMGITLKTVENQMNIAYRKLRTELRDYFPLFLFFFAN